MEPLSKRVDRFMKDFIRAECVDEIVAIHERVELKRADFLLPGRTVIVEKKTLETGIRPKIDRKTDTLAERDDWPVFYGRVEIGKLTRHLEDDEDVLRDVYNLVTRSIERAIKDAEKQIADTCTLLGLAPDTPGMLILLNEHIEDLHPETIAHRVCGMLLQKRDGRRRFSALRSVLLIDEAHKLRGAEKKTFPILEILGDDVSDGSAVAKATRHLSGRWAAFNNAVFASGVGFKPSDFEANSQWELDRANQLPRHELWRRQYRQTPYLAKLTDKDVLEHGRRLVEQLAPAFLVGRERPPQSVVAQLMEGWTHFLEEAEERGLDMRELRGKS